MAAKKKKAAKKTAKKAAKSPAKKAKSAKKAAKKPAAKKAAAKKKAAPKKKAAKAKTKTTAKKAAKSTAKKAAKTTAKTAAKAPAKKAAKKTAAPAAKKSAKGAAKDAKKKGAAAKTPAKKAPAKKAKPRKAITPTGPRHPKLGFKWSCYECGAKFYDLGKEEPICPKCEADQRERPPEEPRPATEVPKPKVVRPMAQLLDDEEPAAAPDDEISIADGAAAPAEKMFDDAENDAGLDIDDDTVVDEGADPPEIDEL